MPNVGYSYLRVTTADGAALKVLFVRRDGSLLYQIDKVVPFRVVSLLDRLERDTGGNSS